MATTDDAREFAANLCAAASDDYLIELLSSRQSNAYLIILSAAIIMSSREDIPSAKRAAMAFAERHLMKDRIAFWHRVELYMALASLPPDSPRRSSSITHLRGIITGSTASQNQSLVRRLLRNRAPKVWEAVTS